MNNSELVLIIPVYNEEECIEKTLSDWHKTMTDLSINFLMVIYNDGSKDDTLEKLNILKKKLPNLKVIDKPNSGHGPTILQGYNEFSTATWIFQTDSDGEMSPKYFKDLWNIREKYDFLIGSRYERSQPLSRKIISIVSRIVVSLFYGRKIYDVNSPYRLFKPSNFSNILNKIPPNTFAPNVILSGLVNTYKLSVFQIDAPYNFRQTGIVSIKSGKLFIAAIKSFLQTILFSFKKK
jgi:dolichol-phosphate mannosyltransferase